MSKFVSAFADDALGKMDAVGIAEALAKKELSVNEVVEASISRAEKVDGELGAIVIKTYDLARNSANLVSDGGLAGIPTFIKDNEDIKGFPTQLGTLAFKAKTANRNSKFVNQMLSTGLICIGKTTLPEFGLICSTENLKWGITRNPWDTDYTTGGSSSGSAAMVASGVVPIASANDGAGSIRIPASCCGLVGLKPSRNRLYNAEGTNLLPLNIIYEGVLTRSVRDTALFYAEAEKFHYNTKLPEVGLVKNPIKQRLKIAFFDNLPNGKIGHQDADTRRVLEDSAKMLSTLGHKVEVLAFPFQIEEISENFLTYYGFLAFMLRNFGPLVYHATVDKSQLEPFTTGLAQKFRNKPFSLPACLRKLKHFALMAENYFRQYDVIMTPVVAQQVPKIGYFSADLPYPEIEHRAISFASFTGLQNVSGSPAISLPLGTGSEGLPIGIQFSSAFGRDRLLLELALELEAAKPWKLLYDQ